MSDGIIKYISHEGHFTAYRVVLLFTLFAIVTDNTAVH